MFGGDKMMGATLQNDYFLNALNNEVWSMKGSKVVKGVNFVIVSYCYDLWGKIHDLTHKHAISTE